VQIPPFVHVIAKYLREDARQLSLTWYKYASLEEMEQSEQAWARVWMRVIVGIILAICLVIFGLMVLTALSNA
jgi:nitric oxide reductase large subunit